MFISSFLQSTFCLPTYALSFIPTVRLRYLVATQLHRYLPSSLRCVALRCVDVDVDVDVDMDVDVGVRYLTIYPA